MALTKSQEIALYQILDIPWQATVLHLVGEDNLVTEQVSIQATTTRQAKAALDDYLALYIFPDADVNAKLVGYLDAWIALGTDVTLIEAGSTGQVSGVSNDPDRERMEIRRQVCGFIPFYRKHDEISQAAKAGIQGVPIIR